MSTDKTLADVQPGGRVRLGDQGDALATLSARWRACADRHDESAREADSIGDMPATVQYLETNAKALRQAAAELDAALSAQPSPGGQGDALRSFACEAVEYFRNRSDVVDGDYGSPSPNEEMKLLSEGEAALAARQPVGEPVAWKYQDKAADGVWEDRIGEKLPCWEHRNPMPLYAVLPAQQADQEYLERLDLALEGVIDQRDRYHEIADDLAGHIATITGVDIGEHSSANCPWQNAIEAAEEYEPAQAVDLANVIDQIAQQWDGYNYDAVGETIDVGQAIRAAAGRLFDSLAVGK